MEERNDSFNREKERKSKVEKWLGKIGLQLNLKKKMKMSWLRKRERSERTSCRGIII